MTRRHPLLTILTATILAGFGNSHSDAAETMRSLSLSEAQAQAVSSAYAVQYAEGGLEGARGARRQSLATLLPTIRVGEEWIRTDDAVGAFGTRLRQERFRQADFALAALNEPAAITDARTTVEMRQPLFSGGAHLARRRAAAEAEQGARADLEWARQHMHFAAAQAYWGFVLAAEAMGVVEAGVEAARGHARQAELAWRAGSIPHSQVLAAQLRVAELEAQQIDAFHRRDAAADALTMLLGWPASTQIEPVDGLTSALDDSTPSNTDTGSDASERTWTRADERSLDAKRRAARHAVRGAQAGYLPQIHAFAQYAWDAQDPFGNDGEAWTAGASLSWSVFDGFLTQGAVQRARAHAAQADVAMRELRDRITREARDAERQLTAARQRTVVAAAAVASAEEHLRVSRIEFNAGILTTTQLLDAEVAWRGARTRHLQALHDIQVSLARREFVAGTPLRR